MHLCSVLGLLASALGLFGVAKVGLKPFQTSSARQPQGQEKPWAQKRWETMVSKRRECKTKCMGDKSCSEQCPKPWSFLREKCDTAKPIWDCHKQCGHDHACREKCPLPQCPKAAEKVKRALQCHGKCGDDRECHHSCGRPFSEFQTVCKSFDEVSSCHKVCVHGDHACHANCPMISWPAANGDQHHHDHDHMKFDQHGSWHQEKPWAQQRWETMMWKRRECKTKCMGDESCSEQCPKPWSSLREKCDTAKPIWDCHKQCGHDHACHEKCPLPQCPKSAEKVKRALQCHGKCGDDRECHHSCGHPFSEFQTFCKSFDEVSSCHKVCVHGDHACHANCPKISWPTLTGDHYDHEHMKFEQQGSWHHHEHGSWDGHKHGAWHNRTHGDWHHHGHDHREHQHHGDWHHHGRGHRERHHHANSSFEHHEHHYGDFNFHHTEDHHHGFHHHENHHNDNSGFHGHKHHHDGHSSSHNHGHRQDGNSNFGPHEHGAKHEHHHAHHAHEHVGEQYVVV